MACILNPSLAPIKMHANERIGQFQPLGSQVPLPATAQVSAVVPTPQNTALRQMEQGIQGLTETEKSKLHHLLEEYTDIISASEEDMGRTNVVRHTINTGDANPVRQPPRRLPFHQRSMVKQMLDDMFSKGIIEPAAGPWSSPIVLVPKKDGSIRFCVDFRRLNSLTKKDAQPLPRIDDTLDTLSIVYLDDIIIYSKTVEDHFQKLREVFKRLERAGLKVKPSKCSLMQKSVCYLGHVVSEGGVATDTEKTNCVAEWPVPANIKELCQFLGLASYYRRFVKNFARIAAPLYQLTEKRKEWTWTKESEEAFATLKQRLTTLPVLSFPRFNQEFILDTDASSFGLGAVLSQKVDGRERG